MIAGSSQVSRWLFPVIAALAVVCATAGPMSSVMYAQDDAAEPAAAEPAAAPAAAPAAGAAPTEEPPKKLDALTWTMQALSYYFFIFLLISVIFVALFVMCLLNARRDNVVPLHLVESFEACLDENKVQEAYDLAKEDDTFLGKVLSAGLEKVSLGYDKAIEAMQEVGEEENMKLDHRLSYLALIGSLSPMIGLFGTVDGMIRAFSVIALGGATPNPAELANGISTALMTTLVGLAIAIPAIASFSILRNRVDRLALEVGITSEGLMSRFQTVGRK
ncbi:MotA/TolQ/ExbB proton channel family protein [Blastopirellula sp. JC732]|uniref:MotA/TolQ/ExbB proton channel family protein n=1 Tax=Blastopirellula sediminis TaxID=2894196 RepID=A0A9X1MSI9_9BACT|nr:MotA/TolQ/ExbB proton channel family protein [Blastopirellula sediminis]MCC9604936.1 MotA/TolQ/ExbB proton channel family protein [Blastopirellula sediminis]MCC9631764.1 MotA/TolQ/ExbB proton channel family protein [Blastopirellula sediminis]